jgi:O-antigen/teichoic acid export membrane protein
MQNTKQQPLDQKSLSEASFSALKWDYAGTATRAVSSLIITVVLARLLGPEPFGLLAAGWLVIGLANLVADLGLGSALLQCKTIAEEDVRYAFTIQVCVGIALMGVTGLAAPMVGHLFNQAKVVPVVRAMSLVFLLQTFGAIAVSLLKRQMDFKRIQFARITSYLAGFLGLGIPLALLGFDVWSLVIAQISQTTLFSILCYVQVRHPIRPLFSLASSGLSHFGFKVLSTNLVNYLISNMDTFFIGHFFDVVILGLYNRVYVLVSTPMNSVVATVQQVTFSAYSRKQDETRTVQRGYLAGFGFMTMLMLPTFGCMALVPGTIIQGLFGSQWGAAVPFLVPLALAMPFHAVMATGGPMLWAQDQVGREFIAQLFTAFVLLVVLFATSSISAIALAWGVLGVTIVRFVLITHASLKTVGASWCTLLAPIRGSAILLILTGSAVFLSDWGFRLLDIAASPRLILDIVAGAGVFVATVLLTPKLIFSPEMCWLAERLDGFLPTWTRPLTKRISPSAAVPA